ncbi:hypothetical protein PQX77_008641 [Marasmius sp. AFHP31]|nr:hypothetical protein PQX77_008641 [Marasmius sp. AFHP31]
MTDFDSSPYAALMDLLTRYSRRWRTLSLNSSVRPSHLQPLDQFTKEDLPLLETVYAGRASLLVVGPNSSALSSPRADPIPFAKLLPQLPSLRSFHSQLGSPLTLDIASTYCRLTQLTLSSKILPTTALRQIAMSCRGLSTLTLQLFYSSRDVHVVLSQGAPVDWPSLRELNLQLEGAGYYNGIHGPDAPSFHPVLKGTFDSILAPQLRRLFVRFGTSTSRSVEDVVPFQDFIASSPCLTHLYILGYNVLNAEYFSRCLKFAPALTFLTVRPFTQHFPGRRHPRRPVVSVPPPEWISKLLFSLNGLGLCLEMESFVCGGCTLGDIDLILGFVQGECRSSTLKHLRADLGSLRGEEVLAVTCADLTERLGALRETKGVLVELDWNVPETIKHDYPSKGMLIEDSPWVSDSYLNQPHQ